MDAKRVDRYLDKAFWVMLLGIAGWVGTSMGKLTDSVDSLNIKMAVMITNVQSHEERFRTLEAWRERVKWTSSRQ